MSNKEEEEEELELDMGKRPSRQRRHLPTAVTSATTIKRKEADNNYKNIPLIKMTFSESIENSDSKQDVSTTTGYNPTINSSTSNKRKKRVNNNNSELKKKTQKFVHQSIENNHSQLKKIVIWITVSLWILFIVYRIISSFKNDSVEHLSLLHFLKR